MVSQAPTEARPGRRQAWTLESLTGGTSPGAWRIRHDDAVSLNHAAFDPDRSTRLIPR